MNMCVYPLEKPDGAVDLTMKQKEAGSYRLSWKRPFNGNRLIISYGVQLKWSDGEWHQSSLWHLHPCFWTAACHDKIKRSSLYVNHLPRIPRYAFNMLVWNTERNLLLSDPWSNANITRVPGVVNHNLLQRLAPGRKYSVRVIAHNSIGAGEPSSPLIFETTKNGMVFVS